MPKARQTCTRCSMRRQKCDRKSPCTRCVQNKEAHLCTREWPNGYNPDVHRKYPKRDTVPHLSAWTGPTGGPTPPTSVAHDHSGTIEEILPLHSNHPPPAPNAYAPSCHPHSHNGLAPQLRLLSPDDERTEQYPPSSNVDFITYGRSDVSDITLDSLLTDDNPYQQSKNISQTQNRMEKTMDPSITLSSNARSAEGLYIQSLLPSREQVFEMVHYHERDMLYWSGGVYHGPSFRKSLLEAYGQSSTLQLQELDWRWSALLFSILSAAVIASPDHLSATWGYSTPEKSHLTKQWGRAAISCLLLGDYTSKFHIYSIQAILNLHSSEHLVGSSREYGLLQTTSIVIARGLGLHRLIPHPDDQKDASELSPAQKDALMQREIGRRVWYSLCFQDWLCVMSSGMYTIQRKHITAARPGHYDEETMTRVDDTRPTWTHCTNYLVDMAALLVDFHDDIPVQNDLEARYEVVLRYDTKIRSLYASKLPWFLSYNTPFDPSWPRWVLWSRRLHQISSYHKIIMVHQSFLGRSFKNPRYTYTRWACTTAAKGIIDYMSSTDIDDGPQWWIEQVRPSCFELYSLHHYLPLPGLPSNRRHLPRPRRLPPPRLRLRTQRKQNLGRESHRATPKMAKQHHRIPRRPPPRLPTPRAS